MKIDLWRTKYHTINGFRQFYRDRQARKEAYLPSRTRSHSDGNFCLSATWSWATRLRVRLRLRPHTWLPDTSLRSCW